MPSPFSVCPRAARLAPKTRCAAIESNTDCSRSRSRNIGYENTDSQSPDWLQVVLPGLGPGADRLTSWRGASTGSGSSRIWLKSEKIAAFAPSPSASDTIATPVTKGVLNSVLSAKRSWRTVKV